MVQALVLPTPLYEKTLSLFTEKQNKTAVAANKKKASSSSSTLVVAALFGHTLAPTKDLVYDVVPLVGLDAELDEDEEDLEDLLQETLRHQVGGSTFLGVCLLTSKSTTNNKSNIVTTALRIMQNTFASFSGTQPQPQGIYVLQSPQDVGGRLACEYYSCGGGASSPQKAAIESPPTSIHLNHITTIVDLSTFPPLHLTSPTTLLLHEAIATTWDSSLRTWLATNVLVTVDPKTYETRLLSKGPLPQKKRGAGAAAGNVVRLHGIIAVHTYIPDTAINDTIAVATDVKLSILLSLRNRLLDATDRAADDSALLQSTTKNAIIKMSFSGLVEGEIPTIGFGNSVKDILLDVGVDRGALLPPLELGAKTKNNNNSNTSIASTSTSASSKDGNKKKKDNNKNQKTLSDQQLVLLIFGVMSFIVSGYMIYLYMTFLA